MDICNSNGSEASGNVPNIENDHSYIKEELGKRLLETRKALKLSQEDVASSLKISRVSLGYYERGERSIDIEILYKLSRLYNISIDYLFGNTPNAEPLYDYNASDEVRELGFTSEALNAMWGNHNLVELLNGIITHKKFEDFEDLTYRARYYIYEDYDKHYRSFLASHLLYEIISDIFDEWYPDYEDKIMTLRQLKEANIEMDIVNYQAKLNCIQRGFDAGISKEDVDMALNELLNKLKRLL